MWCARSSLVKTLLETDPVAVDPGISNSLRIGMRAGPWVVERELGRGGMGTVYAVRHAQIGKRAALKVMHRRLEEPRKNAKRLELEARVVNEIGHPNIVDIFDTGTTDDGRPYIVMEQLAGRSLADCELGVEEVITILRQVCDALIAAHAAGVVHRDLKPDNIFLTAAPRGGTPRAVILDWGIARILNGDVHHTLDGQLLGTPRYLAPEQASGHPVTTKTDVYALGVVAYELVLLQSPYDADGATPREIMAMHVFAPPRPPRASWPEIPPRLESLLLDMLAKAPEARPTMEQVAARLRDVADDLQVKPSAGVASGHAAVRAEEEQRHDEPEPRARSRRWPIAIGAAALLGIAGLLAVALVPDEPTQAQTPSPMANEPTRAQTPSPMGKAVTSDRAVEPAPARARAPAAAPEPPTVVVADPVLEDCADPSVSRTDERWYMTCTGGRGGNIYPIYESSNLAGWRQVAWVFPGQRPAWANGHYWSPELHPIPDGFAAYFTMRVTDARRAIGIATAKTIGGPYRDAGAPLIAPREGASDPHVLVDGGQRYLYFKSEEAPASIQVQRLADDGRAVAGDARRVLGAEAGEHDNIEAPWVVREGEYYYLFYSSSRYCDPDYTIRVARSRSPYGPFEKRSRPVVAGGTKWAAPGHVTITEGRAGERFIIYHAYRIAEGMPSCDREHGARRHVRVDRLEFEDGWPRVVTRL